MTSPSYHGNGIYLQKVSLQHKKNHRLILMLTMYWALRRGLEGAVCTTCHMREVTHASLMCVSGECVHLAGSYGMPESYDHSASVSNSAGLILIPERIVHTY